PTPGNAEGRRLKDGAAHPGRPSIPAGRRYLITTENAPELSLSSRSFTPRNRRPLAGIVAAPCAPIRNGAPLPIRPISAPTAALGSGSVGCDGSPCLPFGSVT